MIILGTHIVADNSEHRRVVDYCIGLFPQLQSRNAVKKAIKRGELLLNGETTETARWVSVKDIIQLTEAKRKIPKAFPISVELVYEDDYMVVVNKPAGLTVSGNQYQTLENALVGKVKRSSETDALDWAVPVHRIDNATQGLVICAKTYSMRIALMQMFENKAINKRYHAVITGKCSSISEIESPIDGANALSYLLPKDVQRSINHDFLTLVELYPKTGRTHQLRKHCMGVGHPIVGDKLYGEKGNTLLHKGLFLAATALSFRHPETDEVVELSIPVPPKFSALMKREAERWKRYNT